MLDTPPTETPDTDAPTDSPSTPGNGEGEPDGGGNSDSDATPKNEDKPDKGPQVVIIDDTGAAVGSDPSPSASESPIIESTAPPSSEQVIVEPDTIAPTPSASLQPTVVDAYQRIDTGEPVIEVTGTKGSEFSSTPAPEAAKHIAQTAINYLVGDDEFQKIHGLIGEVPNPQMDYELHTLRDTLESRLQILANQPNFDQIKTEVYRRLDMAYDIAKNPSLLNESAVNDALKTPQWLIPEKVKYIQLYNIGAKRSGINIPDSGEHAYDKKTKVLTLALANSALVAANTPESLAAQFKAEKEPAPAEQAPTISTPETSSGPITKEVIAAELKIPAQAVRKSDTMAIISSDKEVLDILGLKPNGGYPFPKGSVDGDEYHLYKQNCTSYAAQRQEALGKAVPDRLGNAGDWRAKIQKFIDEGKNYTISTTPTVGAIVQWNVGGDHHKRFGHVAVIEAITANGILISEYNVIKTKSFGLRFLTNEYLQNDTQSGKMVYITLPSA